MTFPLVSTMVTVGCPGWVPPSTPWQLLSTVVGSFVAVLISSSRREKLLEVLPGARAQNETPSRADSSRGGEPRLLNPVRDPQSLQPDERITRAFVLPHRPASL